MQKYFIRFSKTPIIILSVVLFLLINVAFSLMFAEMDASIPDLQFFYTAEKAYQLIESYGQFGREMYIRGTLALDFIYPFVYSIMLSLLLFKATKNQVLSLLPFSILFFDLFENVSLLTIVYNYPVRMNLIATTAGVITMMKWIMVVVTLVVLIYFSLKAAFSKRKNNE